MSKSSALTSRVVRPGVRSMKLDSSKVGKARFPRKKKGVKDRQNTLQYLQRVGRVSMIQIGEDEFRMPNRAERRRAGIGRQLRAPVVRLAQQSTPSLLKGG